MDPRGGDTEIEGDLSEININSPRTTKTYQGAGAGRSMPVSSAISPSLMSSGTASCLISSLGLQLVGIGVSRGQYEIDHHCESALNSQALAGAGMSGGSSFVCKRQPFGGVCWFRQLHARS